MKIKTTVVLDSKCIFLVVIVVFEINVSFSAFVSTHNSPMSEETDIFPGVTSTNILFQSGISSRKINNKTSKF